MKILHIISQSPDFTGSGKFIQEIIRQSTRAGHENYLLAGAQADFELDPCLIPASHCSFVRFDNKDLDFPIPGMSDIMPYQSTVFSTLKGDRLSAYKKVFEKKIAAAIEKFTPDVLHTHHLWLVSAIARKAAPHISMITTCHGTCLRQHHLAPHIGGEIQKELSRIDRIIALSRDQKRQIGKTLGGDPDRIAVISGGYNQDCFYPAAKADDGMVQMLYAGKLSVAKGVPWLLKSLLRIKQMPFTLHIAGNAAAEQKQLCLKLADKLGDRVIYHGPLSHQDLSDLMRKAHIFILPSFYEGLPLVLTEALACGCRLVTTALPGVHELFKTPHPGMVTLVDLPELETIDAPFKKDEHRLEERLSRVLSESIRSVLQNPSPDQAFIGQTVSQYTWTKIFARIESLYKDLTATVT